MTEPIRLALIDDDDAVLDALRHFFARRGLITSCFKTAGKFLETLELRQQFDCIVSDVRMPDMSGLDLMRHFNQRSYALEVILITGHGDVDMAVAAMKEGAFDFIEKPFDEARLLASVNQATEKRRQNKGATAELDELQTRIRCTLGAPARSYGTCCCRAVKQGNRTAAQHKPKDSRKSSGLGNGARWCSQSRRSCAKGA